jgi:hypothetical protein
MGYRRGYYVDVGSLRRYSIGVLEGRIRHWRRAQVFWRWYRCSGGIWRGVIGALEGVTRGSGGGTGVLERLLEGRRGSLFLLALLLLL